MRCRLLLPLLLAACHSFGADLPPAHTAGLPTGERPGDREAASAREALERGEVTAALAAVVAALELAPEHVDARRLRQDLLRQRGRRGRLLWEAEQALRERPDDPIAHYLHGRIVADQRAKLRSFARAAELGPGLVWPWLGLAYTLLPTDAERALAIYERLHAASDGHPLVAVAYAAALRDQRRLAAAAELYAAMRSDARAAAGIGELGLAQVALGRDERPAAWSALLEALRKRPFDPGVQALLHGWLESSATPDQAAQVVDVLREDPSRLRQFADSPGAVVLAELLSQQGQPFAARMVLERRLATAPSPAVRRALRRTLLRTGDVEAFVGRLAADVPEALVAAEDNRLRTRWLTLLRGPWAEHARLADGDEAVALLSALRDVGFLVEVELLADVLRQRFPGVDAACAALRDEARQQLAFEAGLRRLLYQGYVQEDKASLAGVLQRLRELSRRVLGRDVVGEPRVFDVPLIGELVDPFSGPLAEHLDRYNRHLVLGRRARGTAEAMLSTRLSLIELGPADRQDLPERCFEVIGVDRDVRALVGVLGGDPAGVALWNHFLVDHDAVRDWAQSIVDRRRVAREDGLELLDDPLPEVDSTEPLDVAFRLALRSPVPDEQVEAAVLDMIRHHERRHLVDAFHYLPIESNPFRGLGLLFAFGFSALAIEAEMERRAELAALVLSPHTELVLAHIADFLTVSDSSSPHASGFTELARELNTALVALGVPADAAVASRWHLVDPALHRRAAEQLLQRLPLP